MAVSEFIAVENGPEFELKLAGIAERMAMPGPAFGAVMRELEHSERSLFESLGGKYVNTGALEASLTGAATGAVRHLTPQGIEFGSELPYARYQGTSGKGHHRGESAVLKFTEEERLLAQRTVMEYILHGGRP